MGSCVSLSSSPAASTAARLGQQEPATAKVVGLDGSMVQFAGPATAREALAPIDGRGRSSSPCFLCSSDELGFDAPARALAAGEALQPGQLYFVLPASMLRRPMSGKDMAALAVKAATALAVEAGLAAGGLSSRPRKNGGAAGRRRRPTARVAPLLVVSSKESRSDGAWNNGVHGRYTTRETVHGGDRTVGKTRMGAGRRSGARHRAGVQRLSLIAEDSE